MAYFGADNVKELRAAFKTAFPGYSFRLRRYGSSGVEVDIIKTDISFDDYLGEETYKELYTGLSVLDQMTDEQRAFTEKVVNVIETGSSIKWYDKSDFQIDYFDTAFYYKINLGNRKNPYQVI